MSNRTLLEINHDFPADPAMIPVLRRYLNSATRENAEALRRFGVTVVGMRHHSTNFILDGTPEGFPAQYLHPTGSALVAEEGR